MGFKNEKGIDIFGDKIPTQLDRIEAKLDELLAKKKRVVKPRAAKRFEYPDWFERLWASYPKRSGSDPKSKAFSAVKKRTADDTSIPLDVRPIDVFAAGVRRYRYYCKATGKSGTEYVMQAATFFGPDKHYENDWTIPESAKRESLPKNNADLEAFAVKHNLHPQGQAPVGMDYTKYRQWITEKIG